MGAGPARDGITLYADAEATSPWVLSVWVTLKEKSVPFSVEKLDLKRSEHKTGDYAQRTLTGKVPSLRRGDLWIAESLAIAEYLEEVFPPPGYAALFPADPAGRAHDRQILSFLRSDLFELRRSMPFEGIVLPIDSPTLSPRARTEVQSLLRIASARIGSAGASQSRAKNPTLADFELAFSLRRLIHYSYPLTAHPQIVEYADAIWNRPSVQSWVALDRS